MKTLNLSRAVLIFLGCLFSALNLPAQQEIDYEQQIEESVRELEAKLRKMKNPQAREMTEKIIENVKLGRLYVRKYDPKDRWNLVDVQVLPEGGSVTKTKKNESNIRDPFTYETTSSYSASENGYVREFEKVYQVRDPATRQIAPLRIAGRFVVTIEPLPKQLKPGELFEFTVTTRNTRTREGPQSHVPSANLRHTPKVIVGWGRTIVKDWDEVLKTPVHHDENGKPDRKGFAKLSKTLVDTPDELVRQTTYRVKFPEHGPPAYFRIGVDSGFLKDFSDRTRVEYVYLHNGKGPPDAEIQFLDANPQFVGNRMPGELTESQLLQAKVKREGTVADGVSQLIVRAKLTANRKVTFGLGREEDGDLLPLLGGRTVAHEGEYYAFALYTPPDAFGGGPMEEKPTALFDPKAQPKHRIKGVLEFRPVEIKVALSNGKPLKESRFKLARPPVVLVHGFMSDAYTCWVQTKPNGTSMTVLMEKAGLMPFVVNYQKTNGMPLKAGKGSSFQDNSRVVWDRADPLKFVPYYEGWIFEKIEDDPMLSEFQRSKPRRVGGIKQALDHYRDQLGLAATQADVIGHSMGGLLARVYASDQYNPTYERLENFNQGDIHRLITLNTPHHGSELAHVYDVLTEAWVEGERWSDWAVRMVPSTLGWLGGAKTPAGKDLQAPVTPDEVEAFALGKIGKTEIPSYAIATISSKNDAETREYDQHLMYRTLYGTVGMYFFYNRPLLDAFIEKRFQQWREAPEGLKRIAAEGGTATIDPDDPEAFQQYRDSFLMGMDANIYYWESRREAEYLKQRIAELDRTKLVPFGTFDDTRDIGYIESVFSAGSRWVMKADATKLQKLSGDQDVPHTVIAQIQELIFHNDPNNDGAVRVTSQLGSLDKAHTKTIKGVLHSFSPWKYAVQRRVIELLKWDDADFAPEGFKEAGKLTERYLPSRRFFDSRVVGEKAIRWSGMVPEHAEAYAEVADEYKAFVLVRPVNRDSTKLIADGNATKAMEVKGKSSNWGPQKGFIPVQQKYSKLWQVHKGEPLVRDKKIIEFDEITQKMLKKKHPVHTDRFYAVQENLVKTIEGAKYRVLTDPDEKDAEASILLYREYTKNAQEFREFRDWQTLEIVDVESEKAARMKKNPMKVLADGVKEVYPPLYITADYDLLAIGFHVGEIRIGPPQVLKEKGKVKFDPLMGFILPDQKKLVINLNRRVHSRAGYEGGNVTHHGPEVQYAKSPYVDYPIMVCDPGEPDVRGDQELYIIRQGPPGFRDIHLKRFFAEQIKDGFHLWPNPDSAGWQWEAYRKFDPATGYDPRDAATLLSYVEEQTDPDLDEPQKEEDSGGKDQDKDSDPEPEKLDEVAVKELERKALEGDVDAQLDLAFHHLDAGDQEQGPITYRRWLKRASESGRSDAMTFYGRDLLEGKGGETDFPAAKQLFERSIAKDQNLEAHYLLGSMWEYGEAGEEDLRRALQHYYTAAKEGNAEACFVLGDWTYYGKHVEENKEDAFAWYSKAAEQGLHQAHTAVGKYHLYGILGPRDLKKARDHFQQAIDLGGGEEAKRLLEEAER